MPIGQKFAKVVKFEQSYDTTSNNKGLDRLFRSRSCVGSNVVNLSQTIFKVTPLFTWSFVYCKQKGLRI